MRFLLIDVLILVNYLYLSESTQKHRNNWRYQSKFTRTSSKNGSQNPKNKTSSSNSSNAQQPAAPSTSSSPPSPPCPWPAVPSSTCSISCALAPRSQKCLCLPIEGILWVWGRGWWGRGLGRGWGWGGILSKLWRFAWELLLSRAQALKGSGLSIDFYTLKK